MRRTMARITFILVLFTTVIGICYAGRIQAMDCAGVTNRVRDVEVDVSDCPDGNNCTLYRGTTYYLTTRFTSNEDFEVVNMRTLGVMGVLKVPYMGHSEVCPEATTDDGENCDTEVGLVADKTYSHIKDFPVRRMYPEMSMKARVEYFTPPRSTRRTLILCYEVPVKIEAPPEAENEVEDS